MKNIIKVLGKVFIKLWLLFGGMPCCLAMSGDYTVKFIEKSESQPCYSICAEIYIEALLCNAKISSHPLGKSLFKLYDKVPFGLLSNILDINFLKYQDFESVMPFDGKLMVFKNLRINDDYCERKGLGTILLKESLVYLHDRHPDFTMVGYASPYGENKITLDQLCGFYKKHGMQILSYKDSTCACMYMKT